MKSEKKSMVVGILIGIVLSLFYFHFFAPRYDIQKKDLSLIKIDKWTGDSWEFVDNNWKKMINMDENWERIDKTLQEALHTPFVQVDTKSALGQLRERYRILKDISDEELLERIKLVYSKQVLTSMYLNNFLDKDKAVKVNNR